MKVLLIEDEKLAADRITHLLRECDPGIEVISQLDTIKRAVNWFKCNFPPDLVLLDIQLADGICFEIFDEIHISSPIIFTTAYSEYAIRAFKANSIDYLLKPIKLSDLQFALTKFNSLARSDKPLPKTNCENVNLGLGAQYKMRFISKLGNRIISIPVEEVSCFFSQDSTTYLVTHHNKKFIVDYSLDQVELLTSPAHFFRVNRKYLISYIAIGSITDYSNSRLQIRVKSIEQDCIVISRERLQDFKSWLDL